MIIRMIKGHPTDNRWYASVSGCWFRNVGDARRVVRQALQSVRQWEAGADLLVLARVS
jgi:hypothetical protein